MANTVVGIRFKRVGKKYYFNPGDFDLKMYDKCVVETIRGYEMGEVIEDIKEVEDSELISTLKPVHRVATEKDIKQYEQNLTDTPKALERCSFHIRKNKLEMKLLGCEYTLDRTKLIIYFNAEGRIDFRELVKDLANEFRLRIELRQVGTRDGAKFLGGIGPCGYLLCCNTFLGDFETVSIKMAKNQNLSLNPVNISGLCGKLLCCIKFENETYKENRKILPKINSQVLTTEGKARVLAVNVIDKSVRVNSAEDGIVSIKVEDLVKIFEYDKKSPPKPQNPPKAKGIAKPQSGVKEESTPKVSNVPKVNEAQKSENKPKEQIVPKNQNTSKPKVNDTQKVQTTTNVNNESKPEGSNTPKEQIDSKPQGE